VQRNSIFIPQSIGKITEQLAKAFIPLFNLGVDITKFEVVGYSIGATFAGMMGRKIKEETDDMKILPRIVALEPMKVGLDRVEMTDAEFVMTVYTEDYMADNGVDEHVAFYVQGGVDQPNCGDNWFFFFFNKRCSYNLVQKYWIEAVESKSPTYFPARRCEDYKEFENGDCSASEPIGYMNPMTASTLRGDYFLNVNDEAPFAKATADP
jgi:hypothetical protein